MVLGHVISCHPLQGVCRANLGLRVGLGLRFGVLGLGYTLHGRVYMVPTIPQFPSSARQNLTAAVCGLPDAEQRLRLCAKRASWHG